MSDCTCISCGDPVTKETGIVFADYPSLGQCDYCHFSEFGTWPLGIVPADAHDYEIDEAHDLIPAPSPIDPDDYD